MHWQDHGIILGTRRHGETSGIVSILTREHGRHHGLCRGIAGKRLRGVVEPGNAVACAWSGRLADHLGIWAIELEKANAATVLDDPLRLAGVAAATAMVEACLPEREPHPALYDGLTILLGAIAGGDPSWPFVYVRFELGLLSELGFGLDLASCAVTGETRGLTHVSPRSGRAVTEEAGLPYAAKLLRLPSFLAAGRGGPPANDLNRDLTDGFILSAFFLEQRVFAAPGQALPPARGRLVDRLLGAGAGLGVVTPP